jgi:hypothetical protein
MSDKEVLEKAIQKAIDNGCKGTMSEQAKSIAWEDVSLLIDPSFNVHGLSIPMIKYNHHFAKALWGKQKVSDMDTTGDTIMLYDGLDVVIAENWKVNLRSMVIAEDPIRYLSENI